MIDVLTESGKDFLNHIKDIVANGSSEIPWSYDNYKGCPYEPYAIEIGDRDSDTGFLKLSDTLRVRSVYTESISWCLITKQWIDRLHDFLSGKTGVELYAGRGMISKCLQDSGINIEATDNLSWETSNIPYTKVLVEDAYSTVRRYRNKQLDFVICSWIPMDDNQSDKWIAELKEYHPDCIIVYIGEPELGCTANEKFFDNVEEYEKYRDNFEYIDDVFPTWMGMHDQVVFYKAK